MQGGGSGGGAVPRRLSTTQPTKLQAPPASGGVNQMSQRKGSGTVQSMRSASSGMMISLNRAKSASEVIIKEGKLLMSGFQGTWQTRRVVLLSDRLFYTAEHSDAKIASIMLSDVLSVIGDSVGTPKGNRRRKSSGNYLPATPGPSRGGAERPFGVEILVKGLWADDNHTLRFHAADEADQAGWIHAIQDQVSRTLYRTPYQRVHRTMYNAYSSVPFQLLVVSLIFANFLVAICESEMVPEDNSPTRAVFDKIDLGFTAVFTLELLINILSNWPDRFLQEAWNWADTVVVLISLVSLTFSGGIPGVKIIRVFRCFRIVRVFKRLKSLRLIVTALAASIVPIANTLFVLFLATSVFSILGTGLFGKESHEFFGNFSRSFFTMMQCTTGDGWSSSVARVMFESHEGNFHHGIAAFFLAYIVIVCMVIVNCLVAVLLDEFLKVRDVEKSSSDQVTLSEHPFDPLLAELSSYSDESNYCQRLRDLYDALDHDKTGAVSVDEFIIGVKQLNLTPELNLGKEDYRSVFDDLSTPLTFEKFEIAMRKQMNLYVQRTARLHMQADSHGGAFASEAADLLVLKHLISLMENHMAKMPSVLDSPASLKLNGDGGDNTCSPLQLELATQKIDSLAVKIETIVERQFEHEKSMQLLTAHGPANGNSAHENTNDLSSKIDRLTSSLETMIQKQCEQDLRMEKLDEKMQKLIDASQQGLPPRVPMPWLSCEIQHPRVHMIRPCSNCQALQHCCNGAIGRNSLTIRDIHSAKL